uniref:Helicase ATP-binding domain-containing protein n=1 Tax=Parastrongyloides trichosuri TaxID=131310 RepID=A0A0N4ZA99_PARTI
MNLSKAIEVSNVLKYKSENCFHKVFIPQNNKYCEINTFEEPNIALSEYCFDEFQKIGAKVIDNGESLMVSAHTSAGKTVIGEYAISVALSQGKKAIFTAPIKTLSNQKYTDFSNKFGGKVGIITGDCNKNANSQILVVTTEILHDMIIYKSTLLKDVLYIIRDECHFMGSESRGHVWEISIMLHPKDIAMVLLSATMPNNDQMANWIVSLQGRTMHVVGTCVRPVPLKFMVYSIDDNEAYIIKEGHEDVDGDTVHDVMAAKNNTYSGKKEVRGVIKYIEERKAYPCFIYSPSKAKCETFENYLHSINFLNDKETMLVDKLLRHVVDTIGIGKKCLAQLLEYRQFYKRKIFIHHSDIEFTEVCIAKGLAKVTCTTDTLGIGLNLPVKTVVFRALKKFDGVEIRRLLVSEFLQMAGRAGRRGKDAIGNVIAIPSITCNEKDFTCLVKSRINDVLSNFKLNYNMVLVLDMYIMKASSFIKRSLRAYQKRDIKEEVAKVKGMRKVLIARGFFDENGIVTKKGIILRRLKNFKYELVLAEIISMGLLPSSHKIDLVDVLCLFISYRNPRKTVRNPEDFYSEINSVENIFQEIFDCEKHYRVQSEESVFTFNTNEYARPIKCILMGEELDEVAEFRELNVPGLFKVVREILNLIKILVNIDEVTDGVKENLFSINDCLSNMLENDISLLDF